jgi:hypothetical protein
MGLGMARLNLTAGIYSNPPGNVYTDKAMVVVSCEQLACVNFVPNRFGEDEKRETSPHVPPVQMVQGGCAARVLGPLALHAQQMDIEPAEVRAAIGVISKAAGMDPRALQGGIRSEAALMRENIEAMGAEER